MDTQKIPNNVNIFIERVKKVYNPEKIILFGSYAKGTATKNSDVDIAVISDAFSGTELFDRYSKLYDMSNDLYEPPIQAFGFTPQEAAYPGKLTTLKNALNEGIALHSLSP